MKPELKELLRDFDDFLEAMSDAGMLSEKGQSVKADLWVMSWKEEEPAKPLDFVKASGCCCWNCQHHHKDCPDDYFCPTYDREWEEQHRGKIAPQGGRK